MSWLNPEKRWNFNLFISLKDKRLSYEHLFWGENQLIHPDLKGTK
jgi:hypothetical protein